MRFKIILWIVFGLMYVQVISAQAEQKPSQPINSIGEVATNHHQKPDKVLHKIVFQLVTNDTLAWKGLMHNIKNLQEGWGENVAIAVVAHGPGIEFLMKKKTTQQTAIQWYKQQGIEFIACQNTMTQKKITKDEIISEASYVVMGIGEIVERQEKGWSYIKAGF